MNKSIPRCLLCKKKLALYNQFKCKCANIYCTTHRLPELHECEYIKSDEYKELMKLELSKNNPQIIGNKINKI